MKKCNDCGIEKELEKFSKNQKICKSCQNIRYKKRYKGNRENFLKKNNERRAKFKGILFDIKLELQCERCGESHIAVLDFHHSNPKDKSFAISDFVGNQQPNEKNIQLLKEEIEKCEVLCANCHRKEHYVI